MAPVIKALRSDATNFDIKVCSTGQHGLLLSDVMDFFDLRPDITINLLKPGQSLSELTSSAVLELGNLFAKDRPDWVLVQGDTTSAFAGAYSAFLSRCKIGHVEAGLRTYDKYSPFPEEINRKMIGVVADVHFAPTRRAVSALRAEEVPESSIYLTGNTIVDALRDASMILEAKPPQLPEDISLIGGSIKTVLVTSHRRENHESGLANICNALKKFVERVPGYHILFQVHPNPAVRSVIISLLFGHKRITLIDPQPYGVFVGLMRRSHFILTDSGGIQEEGPSLGKPVLIARENTERPEGIEAGCTEMVGTQEASILDGLISVATCNDKYRRMSTVANPFGDGTSSEQIVEILRTHQHQ